MKQIIENDKWNRLLITLYITIWQMKTMIDYSLYLYIYIYLYIYDIFNETID